MMKHNKQNGPASPERYKGGQTMILTVMLLTSAILSATAISALLVLFQLRQVSDIKASTQAIFAADAGIECVLFEKVVKKESKETIELNCRADLENGASYVVTADEAGDNFKSIGRAGRTARAFDIGF